MCAWPTEINHKDLYGKIKKIDIWKNSQSKSLTLLPLWVASFLCGSFPDQTRFERVHLKAHVELYGPYDK